MKSVPILVPALLSGCAMWTGLPETDVIRYATEPAYTRTENGKVIATTCQTSRLDQREAYSELPPGCKRDLVFADQVANPADLTRPAQPGPAAAAPAARAANDYLYGGTDAQGGGGAVGAAPGQVIVTPAGQATAADQ